MGLITDDVSKQLMEEFTHLVNPVRLVVFSQALADPESEQVKRLVEEIAALDPRLTAESYNFVLDKEKVAELGIQRIPAIAILGAERDYGIRMYGLPSGYEFGALVDAILDVSSGDSGLSEPTRAALKEIARPVHLQVFSTPTCPYCPRAVRMAFKFALESDQITADGVEVTGFPDVAQKYNVSSVPKTTVGASHEFVGAGPESMLLKNVQDAAAEPVPGSGLIV
jgi:glutaredoxin-like protein